LWDFNHVLISLCICSTCNSSSSHYFEITAVYMPLILKVIFQQTFWVSFFLLSYWYEF
jgi:hypothetical protein